MSAVENTSFFTQDIANLSSALLKEDDPGEAGGPTPSGLVLWCERTPHLTLFSSL